MTDLAPDERQRWTHRRRVEADAAGLTAARCRRAVLDAIEERDPRMLRSAALAYALLIEKAQDLSDATEGAEGWKGTALDELDQRRARRAAGASVRAPTG